MNPGGSKRWPPLPEHPSERCNLPRLLLRRVGSVWCCPVCRKLWSVKYTDELMGFREWSLVPLRILAQGTDE